MVVHPEGIWYGRLDRDLLSRIVTEHFLGRCPVEEAIVHRQAGTAQFDPQHG